MKRIVSVVRKCIEDYRMIDEGDRIAVGVSGGKDSLTLLCALAELKEYFPQKFELCAITLDMGFEGVDFSQIQKLCDDLRVPFIIKKTDIAHIIFDERKETNPCSLCAKMRRGALNELAGSHGCNKVALGHHNDDALETFFLSLFYEGRLNCFSPVTYLSRADITVIRPMLYVAERDIKGLARREELPVLHNPCPKDGYTKRQEMKNFIKEKTHTDRHFKKLIFHAIQTGIDSWRIKEEKQ